MAVVMYLSSYNSSLLIFIYNVLTKYIKLYYQNTSAQGWVWYYNINSEKMFERLNNVSGYLHQQLFFS